MAIYDLYGFLSGDIDNARNILENSLGVRFEARNGDYKGGGYFQWGKANSEHFVLKWNVDPIDGEPAETSFPAYRILFYVNDTSHSANWQELINKAANDFVLLRREDLD